jgi:hypothetical protein
LNSMTPNMKPRQRLSLRLPAHWLLLWSLKLNVSLLRRDAVYSR